MDILQVAKATVDEYARLVEMLTNIDSQINLLRNQHLNTEVNYQPFERIAAAQHMVELMCLRADAVEALTVFRKKGLI